jgi:hypothetical protein
MVRPRCKPRACSAACVSITSRHGETGWNSGEQSSGRSVAVSEPVLEARSHRAMKRGRQRPHAANAVRAALAPAADTRRAGGGESVCPSKTEAAIGSGSSAAMTRVVPVGHPLSQAA